MLGKKEYVLNALIDKYYLMKHGVILHYIYLEHKDLMLYQLTLISGRRWCNFRIIHW